MFIWWRATYMEGLSCPTGKWIWRWWHWFGWWISHLHIMLVDHVLVNIVSVAATVWTPTWSDRFRLIRRNDHAALDHVINRLLIRIQRCLPDILIILITNTIYLVPDLALVAAVSRPRAVAFSGRYCSKADPGPRLAYRPSHFDPSEFRVLTMRLAVLASAD